MNNRLRILTVYLALVLVGCASFKPGATPRDRYADAERAFTVVLDVATTAYRSGKLNGDNLVLVKAALIEANGALTQMHKAVKDGDTANANYWLDRVEAVVRVIQAHLSKLED